MVDHDFAPRPPAPAADSRAAAAHVGQAGALATLIMLAVQLIWRLNWSHNGVVQAFPEFIVAAVSRLTPLSVFGAATENYGSSAKKTLFLVVLIFIVSVGFRGGLVAGWLSRKFGRGGAGRTLAGLTVAAALLLFTLVVVLPIAHLGAFASGSSYTATIITQLAVTFALYGLAWAFFSRPREELVSAGGETLNRRAAISQGVLAGGTIAAAVAVGGATWRLLSPRKVKVDAAVKQPVTQDIVATQRARQGHPLSTPTPQAAAQTVDVAQLDSDVALQDDPFALFMQLDAGKRITPVLTATDDFYHVSKNLSDPSVDGKGWTLKVTGLVEKELTLTYDDVVKRATTSKITTLSCISNEINGDLAGTAEWTALPLMDLLNEAGVKAGAVDIKMHAADDYEDSIPLARAMDPDTIVVVAMNGAPLRDDHGYPCRLIVPGIYGMKNVKWLDKLEVVDNDVMGYWQSRGWSDTAVNQIWGRIDQPEGGKIDAGPTVATGVASAGDRDVKRVEVSLDDGKTWSDATLEPSLNPPFTWVRWAFPFDAQAGTKYKMKIRATDGAGEVMIETQRDPLPDGATGWPSRGFEAKG